MSLLSTTPAAPSGTPTLAEQVLVVVGPSDVTTHRLTAGASVSIGRGDACDLCLPHESVSRRHAIVRFGAPSTVQDLNSRNGIQLRGSQVKGGEAQVLLPGETFQVGPFLVSLLSLGDAPTDASGNRQSALSVDDPSFEGLSPTLMRVAESHVSVLIRGETGVGKEVLAQALHRRSGRRGPLLAINCAGFNDSLLESELFGHERGAFTGAVEAKVGLLESAAGGTVLLDELGEMPPGLQAKLLRALEARQIFRVGGVRPVQLDVRFLAATHRDILGAVTEGGFRQDLYYRLAGITLLIRPLRDRPEAIVSLAVQFLAQATRGRGRLSAAALARVRSHPWPGNVRELRCVIDRAVLLAGEDEIQSEHVVLDGAPSEAARAVGERERILEALETCAGNQTRAARMLGISRATLVTKLTLHSIPRPRTRALTQ